MKNRVWYLAVALAASLAGLAWPGYALTLGELRGQAVIGRPLDVSVRVQAGPAEEPSAACFTAELYHADARQATPSVSVAASTGSAASALVRIQSAVLVDEPVVSVLLRFNCGSIATRRYVLLADLPPTGWTAPLIEAQTLPLAAPAVSSRSPAPTDQIPSRSALDAGSATKMPAAASAVKAAKSGTGSVRQAASGKVRASVSARSQPVQSSPGRHSRAVLKLDPLDLLSDRVDSLDTLMVFAPTEDALRYTGQIASLQGDVKVLQDKVAKSDAKLADLRAQLQQAQAPSIPVAWLYALVAVLLAAAAVAALWWRQRSGQEAQVQHWHDQNVLAPDTVLMPRQTPLQTEPAAFDPVDAAAVSAPEPPPAPMPAPIAVPVKTIALAQADAPVTGFGGIHSLSVEPILDIRQQAEFFVSLGQTERALGILKKQISDTSEPNPFIYLDLLALYHSLGLKADFRECRKVFNQYFNGVVPDFPAFHLEGQDLLAHPEVLAQLVATWPSANTLVYLDTCIFHNTQTPARTSFDLAAFRDLLMLHALAEEVATDLTSDRTSPAPPSVALPVPQANLPQETPSRMLDLDFSTLGVEPISPVSPASASATRWPVTKKPH